MQEYFEIAGVHIKFSEIDDFRIVKCEYIFRPVYKEEIVAKKFGRQSKEIVFSSMQPYAAIKATQDTETAVSKHNPVTLAQAVVKDAVTDIRTTVGDKLNIKAIRSKRLKCINQAGREFSICLEDVPAVFVRADGKISDVLPNDELYHLLGEPIAPTINFIDALQISTKAEKYIFLGAGIQLTNPMQQYNQLKYELEMYLRDVWQDVLEDGREASNKQPKIPSIPIPQIPTVQLPELKMPVSLPKLHKDKKEIEDCKNE